MRLIGPLKQIVTLRSLPLRGPITDAQLEIIEEAGILIHAGRVVFVDSYKNLENTEAEKVELRGVLMPGFVDAHTHLCFAGSRHKEYAMRLNGISYEKIAAEGGGILNTVEATRRASREQLIMQMLPRLDFLRSIGVTTCEIKSGYGLNLKDELKLLVAIREVGKLHPMNLVHTCLAAHALPPEFSSKPLFLQYLAIELLPKIHTVAKRIDIFVDRCAFSPEEARPYLEEAKHQGFDLTLHANQFSSGGVKLAVEMGALSADHLETLTDEECTLLGNSETAAVILPGSSIGLGVPFAPARKLLDAGAILAIASDWNPGSAPQGNLLSQAATLGAREKLTTAETFAGMTFRAAHALGRPDRGTLAEGMKAHLIHFPCNDYREILYHQGSLTPNKVFS